MNGSRYLLALALVVHGCGAAPADPKPAERSHAVYDARPADAKPVIAKPRVEHPIRGCPPGEHDVRRWTRIDPSTVTEEQDTALGNSWCGWAVSIRDAKVVAKEHEESTAVGPPGFALPDTWGPPRVVARGGAGVLFGFNRGEWGGALLWYAHDGKLKQTLVNDNVVDIVATDSAFLVFTGLAHLGTERGRVIELRDADGRFRIGRKADLRAAPLAVARDTDGTVLVATFRRLLRLDANLRVERVLDAKWSSLYPRSMVFGSDRTLYLGMRSVVAEVNLAAKPPTVTWLSPEPLKASPGAALPR